MPDYTSNDDIRKTGPIGLRGMRSNVRKETPVSAMSDEEIAEYLRRSYTGSLGAPAYDSSELHSYGADTPMGKWGLSKYDNPIMNAPMEEQGLQDTRYNNQPWYDVLANGVAKMLGTAGTTFVSSVLGVPYGLFSVAAEMRPSAIWDNDLQHTLAKADDWLEENFKNHQSTEQQEDPHFRLGDMNWWADNVIKNAGFTIGAAAAGSVGAGALGLMSRAMGFVNNVSKGVKTANALASSLFAATGEGMIEARQAVEDRNRLEFQSLEDAMLPQYRALEMEMQQANAEYEQTMTSGLADDPAYMRLRQKQDEIAEKRRVLDERRQAAMQEIQESGRDMGNRILFGNQVFLAAGDFIQFGKAYVKSFDKARHMAEMSTKTMKPTLVNAKRVGNDISKGYKITGKNLGKTLALLKNPVTEGNEEMAQQFISSAAGAYYDRKDANDYWRARLDPESIKEASDGSYSLGNALSQGFKESYGTFDQWEQFLIGAMTGAMGTVAPTKVFNQDKDKAWYNPSRYFSWAGGIKEDLDEFNKQYNQYEENINDLNKIVTAADFPNKIQRLAAHTSFQKDKEYAAFNNEKKLWKDADDKQNIIDIQAFLRAGKIDDLRAIYDNVGEDMSDDDIESLIKMTTQTISKEEDEANHAKLVDEEIAGRQLTISDLEKQIEIIDRRASLNPGNMPLLKGLEASRQKIRSRIDDENQKIEALKAAKESYQGEVKYFGPFLNEDGRYTKSVSDVREEIKHNAQELNRKLDSYLDSIDRVNRDTNGMLTKEQEDNLAYLHNLGKESEVRVDKIMARARKVLPKKIRIKTNKTPEQLTAETASSDLTFSRNDDTPEGYVEVDTSLMTDEHFSNFFVRDILMGGLIDPDFSKLADEEGTEGLNEEEAEKKRKEKYDEMQSDFNNKLKEQLGIVFEQIQREFRNNSQGKSDREVSTDLLELYQDLMDARDLMLQAGQYRATLTEYMSNPGKVEEDKEKEEKKNEEKTLKDKFKGKTAKDINNAVASGEMQQSDVDDFISGFDDFLNVTDEDRDALQAAQDHNDMLNTAESLKQEVKKAATAKLAEASANGAEQSEFDAITQAAEMAEGKINDIYLNAENAEGMDPDEFLRILDEEKQQQNQIYDELNNFNPGDINTPDIAYDLLNTAVNAEQENKEKRKDIPDEAPAPSAGTETPEETGSDPVTKVEAPSALPDEGEAKSTPDNPVISPVSPTQVDSIIQEVRKITNGELNNAGTWRNTTRRYQYHSSAQRYYDTLPKDSIKYKRSLAIHTYLRGQRAFDEVENADNPAVVADETVIHFMVKNFSNEIFGKEYEDLNDEDKNTALVILMLNDNGQVVGDLPLAKWEPSALNNTPNEQVKMLMALEKKVTDAFNDNYARNHVNEAIVDDFSKDGVQNLNLKFKNGRPLVSRVTQVMNGLVPFVKGEINSINEIAGNEDFILGISVVAGEIATVSGKNDPIKGKILGTKTGKLGTPYYLVKTSAGNYVPVPFYTPAFDAARHADTDLYRLLVNAVKGIITNNDKEVFKRNMDVIKGLLQVEGQKKVKRIFEVSPSNVKVHFNDILDTNRKIEVSVPNAGSAEEVAKAIVNSLSGTPINISLQFINRKISTGGTSNNMEADYNRVIGAIANMNMPKDTRHTINSWFTIALATDGGLQRGKRVGYKTSEPYSDVINGKAVVINPITFTATTPDGDPIYDEDVMLVIAKVKAKEQKLTTPFKLQVGSETWTYSPEEERFTKKTEENAPVPPSTEEPAPVEEEGSFGSDFYSFYDSMTSGGPSADDTVETFTLFGKKPAQPEEAPAPAVPAAPEEAPESAPESPAPAEGPAPVGTMTIEDINDEVADLGILSPQTQDAWKAIPDELKLKMYNEGVSLIVRYGDEQTVISADNDLALERALTNINPAAQDGNVSVEEAPKTMSTPEENTVEDQEAARRWLAKNLPMLNSSERVKFVSKLAYAGKDGMKVWGTYKNSMILILENAPMGTTYHEAFHYVVDMLLDKEQKDQLFNAAREQYGKKSLLELEENLAEDFRKYCLTENARGIIGKLKRWFRRLKDAILRHSRIDNPTINTLFWNINNGKFAQAKESKVSYDRYTSKVAESVHRARERKMEWKNIGDEARRNLEEEGLNIAQYSNMSLAEQEQWIKCRT